MAQGLADDLDAQLMSMRCQCDGAMSDERCRQHRTAEFVAARLDRLLARAYLDSSEVADVRPAGKEPGSRRRKEWIPQVVGDCVRRDEPWAGRSERGAAQRS